MIYKFKDIIEEVDEFNSELKYGLDDIVGVTIEKGLIPTVANLSQTNLDKFYLVKKNTFVYNPRTHGVRLGMGFNETDKIFITSWNNVAFKVKTEHIVLPKYLWMFFNRPEWDRQSNYLAWGSSTIVFAWKDFLEISIDLPPLEEQRKIVTRYKAIETRIANNKQTIAKLEEATQALYRKMFVDDVDVENLPDGWRMGCLGEVGDVVGGATPLTSEKSYWVNDGIKWLSPMDLSRTGLHFIYESQKHITQEAYNSCSTKMLPAFSVLFSSRAPIGLIAISSCEVCTNQGFKSIIPKKEIQYPFIYFTLINEREKMDLENSGSTFNEVSAKYMESYKIIVPNISSIEQFNKFVLPLFNHISNLEKENEKLIKMLSLMA